ncbi:MAG: phenylalanine--tRNA ligase subunit beta [Gammaproteobacteria bacterium]|jgi:phenylalanyl-tRNA synthetase beta chain|nr:phenylalanine--tRNA ligase subunit beta [Gammaproteobacteria bacterium]MBQ08269.1 phenylalanine--tRNA ligase subunit beta [Gammaproteobacteria bacterium]MDP6147394.1 phenylalanine--tRNA ligase subunit beta [Gammaproteobacteria bacterium]HJL80794.1 phenylalanine--tRNA ligase subunit beta [Gammaproteobacteria bacterium]HJM09328.1 phenylalanine--tRNA ligase subunit beta [Gammaproteobacteria bacterium]|tara:strand:+ start:794 stop:2833 length:2040 start_codon:yes stop_codon:yes gene_type:complete
MKLPVTWLNESFKKDYSASELSDLLTLSGIESEIEKQKGEYILDITLTPNRADCFSYKGIVQEISALDNSKIINNKQIDPEIHHNETMSVDVKAKKDSPVFMTRVIKSINNDAKTPKWLIKKLEQSGYKSINAIVDIANYVMVETGQPLHTYDLDKINTKIIVRRAKDNEVIDILDGSRKNLDSNFLVIADEKKCIGIAGIMGSLNSGISDSTQNIVIESAYFNFETIMGRARSLSLHSEASMRFERGVDPEIQEYAIQRFTSLLNEIANGQNGPLHSSIDDKQKPKNKFIMLRKNKIRQILGITIPNQSIKSILNRLNMEIKEKDSGYLGWSVRAPSYRFDINEECDLIEEISRVYGFDQIPETIEQQNMALMSNSSRQLKREKLDSIFHGLGYNEVVNYSFVSPSMNSLSSSNKDMIDLQNPISIEMSVMRNSLWPGLLSNLSHNIKRQHRNIRIFEVGKHFASKKKAPIESNVIAGLIYGHRNLESWAHNKAVLDFFDLKGHMEDILSAFGLKNIRFNSSSHSMLCPGVSAEIKLRNKKIGVIGMLSPELSSDMKLEQDPFLFEIDYDALNLPETMNYASSTYYPSSRRDLSFLISKEIRIDEVLQEINRLMIKELRETIVFDLFNKKDVDNTQKSISIGLIFQAKSRTLTDVEIDEFMSNVIKMLELEFQIRIGK